jgi:sirohydrochlorin ferrochelatase
MTLRLRHRRARAYCRANAAAYAHWRATGSWCPVLCAHESHAHGRLPEAARNAIQDWGNK